MHISKAFTLEPKTRQTNLDFSSKFRHNKYNDYFDDANCENDNVEEDDFETRLNNELALKKIKSINKELHQNISNPKILDILNEIERVICKINL